MCTNCDERQQAVQPSHGTSDPRTPRTAARISSSHDEKSPAARSGVSVTRLLRGDDARPDDLVVPGLLVRIPKHPKISEAARDRAEELGEVPPNGSTDTDRSAGARVEHFDTQRALTDGLARPAFRQPVVEDRGDDTQEQDEPEQGDRAPRR